MRFLTAPTRFLFFTGKGGVGKTSIACATAVRLAGAGHRVLLVSTDPASNVGQVFSQTIGNTITPVTSVAGLDALEIDPEQAAEEYRERIIGPVRGLLPEKEIASITEQLSGSCTTEIASFNEFTGLLADRELFAGYEHVIFDTAPTGHTIRLLKLPGDWTGFLDAGKGDASCLGPLSGLEKQRAVYAAAVAALADPTVTSLVLVARAQASSLAEIARTADELTDTGIRPSNVVINGVMPRTAGAVDDLAQAIRDRESAAIAGMPVSLADVPRDLIDLKPENMVGLAALRSLFDSASAVTEDTSTQTHEDMAPPLDALIDEFAPDGHGLIMCMGKGGVGKTTIAAAIAIRLAQKGHEVHLTTTDPAGNDPCSGSQRPGGRPQAGQHRAVGLGCQPVTRSRIHHLPASPAPGQSGARAHRRRTQPRSPTRHRSLAREGAHRARASRPARPAIDRRWSAGGRRRVGLTPCPATC